MATTEGGFTFDVFLSHNSRDKPRVRELTRALKERNLKVWLDQDELPPRRLTTATYLSLTLHPGRPSRRTAEGLDRPQ